MRPFIIVITIIGKSAWTTSIWSERRYVRIETKNRIAENIGAYRRVAHIAVSS